MARQGVWTRAAAAVACLTAAVAGCAAPGHPKNGTHADYSHHHLAEVPVPKELNKVALPPYMIETPDILLIDAIRTVPLPPYRVEPLDVLYINGKNVFESDPINGLYPVDPDGTVNLGSAYGGAIRVADLTTEEIARVIQAKVRGFARNAEVTVSLAQSRGVQQISGQHIVRPDGTVGLGSYGSVYVTGMTLAQAKCAIEAHLSKYLYKPEVAVDVFAFNSKFYYVITDFAGNGDQVARLPHTGNETVLDAISQVGGRSAVSSYKIWVARPSPTDCGIDQILPVDWKGVTRRGQVNTNYQLMPGDRVFVQSQPWTRFDTGLARFLAPINRAMGTVLLGTSVAQSFRNNNNNGFGNGTVTPIIPIN